MGTAPVTGATSPPAGGTAVATDGGSAGEIERAKQLLDTAPSTKPSPSTSRPKRSPEGVR